VGLWLLVGLILIQFFPLPVLPGVNLAPENFVFLLALLFCGRRLSRLRSPAAGFGRGPGARAVRDCWTGRTNSCAVA
jgi:hypothetical protein